MAVDGTSNRPIDRTRTRAQLRDLTWSPDGTKLAYVRTERKRESLYTIEANGQSMRRLGSSQLILPPIAWSPDGAHIAFAPARVPRTVDATELKSPDNPGSGVERSACFGVSVADAHAA